MAGSPPPMQPSARRGRRVAQVLYWGLVVAVGVACAAQVTLQVYFDSAGPSPFKTCHEGLRQLHGAVVRARQAAAAGQEGEDAALATFRRAVEDDWRHRDGVAASCRGSAKDLGTLDAIERLRYAEEHAVRREAGELAPLRRRVQAIVETELAPAPGP